MSRKGKNKFPSNQPKGQGRSAVAASVAGTVRIIGGSLRGRKLEYQGDPRTRPMKDRVREAIFNLLGNVADAVAIDLFAGTGALGFEALSRGARAAVFFEQHFPTAGLIQASAASLSIADRCEIIAADTLTYFRRAIRWPELVGASPWIVFSSPPYDFYVDRRDGLLSLLEQLWQAAPVESAFVVEADERFDFAGLPEASRWDLRSYPPAHVGLAWKSPGIMPS